MPIKKRVIKKLIEKKTPLNLILLGDPGAGKATQSALLAKKYSFLDFDMGRELTLARQRSKVIEAILQKTTDRGILAPTKVVRKIFKVHLSKVPVRQGILFDGTPKMLGEAKLISGLLKKNKRPDPLVIYLHIPESEIIKRVSKRKGYSDTKFGKRSDDSSKALKNRARYYKKNIKEVTDYFSKIYPYVRISALGTKSEVNSRIIKEIIKHS